MTVSERLTDQAEQCARMGSRLYADILSHAADDVRAGGPSAEVLVGRDDDAPGSALALRFMAALHRRVLQRQAPALALHYPSVGGHADPAGAWVAARRVLAEQRDVLRTDVLRPCQTNEPGRAAVLLTGLLHVATRWPGVPLRLLEIGASAGLNLHVDRYRIGAFGPATPLVVADPWEGRSPAPVPYPIVDRAGCDPAPVDPASADGRLTLSSSVWADQVDRFQRLRVALDVAAAHPVAVERASAAGWLPRQLGIGRGGRVTVVWHSVVWQYLSGAEQRGTLHALREAGALTGSDGPLVHLAMEPELRGPPVRLAT